MTSPHLTVATWKALPSETHKMIYNIITCPYRVAVEPSGFKACQA
jgi:hypothetical protein